MTCNNAKLATVCERIEREDFVMDEHDHTLSPNLPFFYSFKKTNLTQKPCHYEPCLGGEIVKKKILLAVSYQLKIKLKVN